MLLFFQKRSADLTYQLEDALTDFTPDCIARLKRVSTATLTTQLFKRGFRNVFIQGVRPLGTYGVSELDLLAMTLEALEA